MDNSVIVYRSKREQVMDEFWMSEDGQDIIAVTLGFLIGCLLTVWLVNTVKEHRRNKQRQRRGY